MLQILKKHILLINVFIPNKEVMDAPIDSVITYKGHKIQIVAATDDCENCIFNKDIRCLRNEEASDIFGECSSDCRDDRHNVIFKQID